VDESAWPWEYANLLPRLEAVRGTPKTAAKVALFGSFLTVTSLNRVVVLILYYFKNTSLIKFSKAPKSSRIFAIYLLNLPSIIIAAGLLVVAS
jgi:hypothetical protein